MKAFSVAGLVLLTYLPLYGQFYTSLNSNITQEPPSLAGGVTDIQSAFNHGRTQENQQLGTSLPQLTFPSGWSSMGAQERAAWILRKERADRGLKPFTGTDPGVVSIAQYYADYLFTNDVFGHNEDGHTPVTRLETNATIAGCKEFTYSIENLYITASASTADILYEVEYALYSWLYVDAGSAWGHRNCLLQNSFNDNSGTANEEGLFGIGIAEGGPYQGPFSQPWNHAEIVVFEVIDPCASWEYTTAALAEKDNEEKYNIYSDGENLHITAPSFWQSLHTEVYTLLGTKIYENNCTGNTHNTESSYSFVPGTYIVRISSASEVYAKKVVTW